MAEKLDLPDIGTLGNPITARAAINSNFTAIENAFDNTLSRDGTTPNQMEADIDMNGNDLLNVKRIDVDELFKNGVPFEQMVAYGNKQFQLLNGTGAQTTFPLTEDPGSLGNLYVSVGGLDQKPGIDYNYSGTTLTFTVAPASGTNNIYVRYDKALPTGVTEASAVNFVQVGAGASSRTALSKMREWFSVKDFNEAAGEGVINAATAINAALVAAAANNVGTVWLPKGTYTLDSGITLKAGVRLLGEDGARIVQRNSANLNPMIDFGFPTTADSAVLENLVIDGNWDNNTVGASIFVVHVRTASHARIKECTFQNAPGYFIATNGVHTQVTRNRFLNCYMAPVFFYHGPTPQDAYGVFKDNVCTDLGGGACLFENSNYGIVQNNVILGTIIGGRGSRVTVNTSGTTVTWASGTNFASIKKGMWVVLNNGLEFKVVDKVSDTVLTVETTLPTLSGTQASVGTGDLIGNISSSFCKFTENVMNGGATYGTGGVAVGSFQCSNNLVANNIISQSGKHAINFTYDSGAGFLDMNSIVGNKIFNPGNSGGISTNDKIGIFLHSGSAGKLINHYVQDNTITSAGGDGQTEYWLGMDGTGSAGSVFVGANLSSGMVNAGIKNDILSAVADAAWGSTATVTDVVSHGNVIKFSVNCSGSGISFNPSVTITKISGALNSTPIVFSKMLTTTGAYFDTFGENQSTVGVWKTFLNGTPTTANTYVIAMHSP